jgi:hypothetical protein
MMLPTRPGVTSTGSTIKETAAMTDRLSEATTEVMQGQGQSPGVVLRKAPKFKEIEGAVGVFQSLGASKAITIVADDHRRRTVSIRGIFKA